MVLSASDLVAQRPRSASPPDLEAAVIGAGPHGLSAAVHLRRAGVGAQVFGSPMSFWRAMPGGMKLRSNLRATNMIEPAGPYSLAAHSSETGQTIGHPVPLERFLEYGDWVQRAAVPDLDTRMVAHVERVAGGFSLQCDDGQGLTARRVVVAAGIAPFARIPPGFGHLTAARVSHSSQHRDLSSFAGRRVLVVGGGQSALEYAALMTERGAAGVEVLVRAPTVVWLRGHALIHRLGRLGPIVYAPTDVGPLWYSRLVSVPELFRRLPRAAQDKIAARCIRPACSHFVRVRLGEVAITNGVKVTSACEDDNSLTVTLSDGSTREADHLMFGTGYRVDIASYPFLSRELLGGIERVEGYPVLGAGLEASVPGLHFMGAPAAWSFGPIMRFVSGSWHSGRALAAAIAGSRVAARA
ncbi:MAG: NAD(P)-binding domain-containing protein [Actinomycetota bacterium]|nr:NAD(P)-binding domain-containing protein [Actinomycetota bacterium]